MGHRTTLSLALALLASACAGTSGFTAADLGQARAPGGEGPAAPPTVTPNPTPPNGPPGDPVDPAPPPSDPEGNPGLLAAVTGAASGAGGGWVGGLGETVSALGDQVSQIALLPSPADHLFVTAGGALSRLGDAAQAVGAQAAEGPGGAPLAGPALAGAIGVADGQIAGLAAVNAGALTTGAPSAPLGVSLLAPTPAQGGAASVALLSGGSLVTAGAAGGAPVLALSPQPGGGALAVDLSGAQSLIAGAPAATVPDALGATGQSVGQTVGGLTGQLGGLLGR